MLPAGITGFFDGRRGEPPPSVDARSFARACHNAARAESGHVERFDRAGIGCNYHRAFLRLPGGDVAVLCNAHHPWIACAAAGDDLPLRFVEAAAFARRVKEAMPCEVPSLSSLEARPDADSLAGLDQVEREQVRYWRPARLGDIIFHVWD